MLNQQKRDNTKIKAFEPRYNKIYAYTLPQVASHDGYIKVGETTQKDVNTRIKQQVGTVNVNYQLLWTTGAFRKGGVPFHDRDLHAYFTSKGIVRKNLSTGNRPSEWFYFNGTPELCKALTDEYILTADISATDPALRTYSLRDEQQSAVDATVAVFESLIPAKGLKEQTRAERRRCLGTMLWNAKPRFGKTLTAYELVRKMRFRNVLILTNRPTIGHSWYDDFRLFRANHQGEDLDYLFICSDDNRKRFAEAHAPQDFSALSLNATKAGHALGRMAFYSLQDLKTARFAGGKFDKHDWISKTDWDLVILDEAHEGVDTQLTKQLMMFIGRRFELHLSGTPFKALTEGKHEHVYHWTYLDEQQARATFPTQHPNADEENPYSTLPQLHLFNYELSDSLVNQMAADVSDDGADSYAFNLNDFFCTDSKGNFVHDADVDKFLANLTQGHYPFSPHQYPDDMQHTFWLLQRVSSVRALAKKLREHPVFSRYEIIEAVGKGTKKDQEKLETEEYQQANQGDALAQVRAAIERVTKGQALDGQSPKIGTITLSVGMLTTGVTVPEWTGVFMLSDLQSPEKYWQAAFRAQTPCQHTTQSQNDRALQVKERAYVFDFAPQRTLQAYAELAENFIRAHGQGDALDRRQVITRLLNYFPVLGVDEGGTFKELTVEEVMTKPVATSAAEVVRRGFMSNLLFQNISAIFNNATLKAIVDTLPRREADKAPQKSQWVEDGLDANGQVVLNDAGQQRIAAVLGQGITDRVILNVAEAPTTLSEEEQASVKQGVRDNLAQARQAIEAELTLPATERPPLLKTSIEKVFNEKKEQTLARKMTTLLEEARAQQKALDQQYEADRSFHEEMLQHASAEEREANLQAIDEDYHQAVEKLTTSVDEAFSAITSDSIMQAYQLSAQEQRRKNEQEARKHLNGFARAVPYYLMAYGDKNTSLATLGDPIDDATFEAIFNLPRASFAKLRDGFEDRLPDGTTQSVPPLINAPVFDRAVTTFLAKRQALSQWWEKPQSDDIFNYIPNQKTNQIFTPKAVARTMVETAAAQCPDLFTDPSSRFLDPYVKSGLFLAELARKLFVTLKPVLPNDEARKAHIFDHMLWGLAPGETEARLARAFLYGDPTQGADHLKAADLSLKTDGKTQSMRLSDALTGAFGETMKFDLIIGNPPYQEEKKDNNRTPPLYHLFMQESYSLASRVCFITPARFLSNAGQTPEVWNNAMLQDPHLKILDYNIDGTHFFPTTDIKGGIVITYHDTTQKFVPIKKFIPDATLRGIWTKVTTATEKNTQDSAGLYLDSIISSRGMYRFTDEYLDKHDVIISTGTGTMLTTNTLSNHRQLFKDCYEPGDIGIYGRLNRKGTILFLEREALQLSDKLGRKKNSVSYNANKYLDSYNVILPRANGSGALGEALSTPVIGQPVIGQPVIGHTDTYISIGCFDTREQAVACLKYIKSRFARTMLGVLKVTQDNPKDSWAYVPKQNFGDDSDIDWSLPLDEIDNQLFDKYGLTEAERLFILHNVTAMDERVIVLSPDNPGAIDGVTDDASTEEE